MALSGKLFMCDNWLRYNLSSKAPKNDKLQVNEHMLSFVWNNVT